MRHVALVLALLSTFLCSSAQSDPFSLRNAPVSGSGSSGARGEFKLPDSAAFLGADGASVADPPKSKTKAVLYSLLLPGMGHRYAGDRAGAATFLTIEAAVWTSFIVFEVQGNLRESGYEDNAQVFAGVSRTGHSDDYYSVIAEYDSWEAYEASVKSEGRFALYPDAGAAALEAYWEENRVSDYEPWVWKSADDRRAFRSLRSSSKTSYRRALYAVALAVANRAASAFFAIKATNDANRKLETSRVGYRVEFGPPVAHAGGGFQTGLSLVATF